MVLAGFSMVLPRFCMALARLSIVFCTARFSIALPVFSIVFNWAFYCFN